MATKKLSAGQKAARTRKRRKAAKKAVRTRKRKKAARKAVETRKANKAANQAEAKTPKSVSARPMVVESNGDFGGPVGRVFVSVSVVEADELENELRANGYKVERLDGIRVDDEPVAFLNLPDVAAADEIRKFIRQKYRNRN
jgi:hypothetical protein